MRKTRRILGLHFFSHGFGWIVFERDKPVDWGVIEKKKDRNAQCLFAIERIVDRYQPDTIVLEAFETEPKPRAPRIRELCRSVTRFAIARHVATAVISRAEIRSAFAGTSQSRYATARAVADRIEELRSRLPKKRAIWESEQPNMALFSAAAAVLAFRDCRSPGLSGD